MIDGYGINRSIDLLPYLHLVAGDRVEVGHEGVVQWHELCNGTVGLL